MYVLMSNIQKERRETLLPASQKHSFHKILKAYFPLLVLLLLRKEQKYCHGVYWNKVLKTVFSKMATNKLVCTREETNLPVVIFWLIFWINLIFSFLEMWWCAHKKKKKCNWITENLHIFGKQSLFLKWRLKRSGWCKSQRQTYSSSERLPLEVWHHHKERIIIRRRLSKRGQFIWQIWLYSHCQRNYW